jgi:hypothetical protein
MQDPEDYPCAFMCNEENTTGFRIGDYRILYRPERIAQGNHDDKILHMMDIIL